LIPRLLAGGHKVSALVRPESQEKLPAGCDVVTGDALDAASYQDRVRPATTFVQLVGVAHPSPAKAAEFRCIDLIAGREAVAAASYAGIQHFVYVSVAQPAPMMKAYLEVRAECEAAIRSSGMHATILRPWYVLGPGHRWPYLLIPAYWLFEKLHETRRCCAAFGPGYFGADAAGAHERRYIACTERARPWCAADSAGQVTSILICMKPA
jgi:uncharacterized protein YbjT (DUF2867 family)